MKTNIESQNSVNFTASVVPDWLTNFAQINTIFWTSWWGVAVVPHTLRIFIMF